MNIYLDVSQLVAEPRRSGIQRVERELIRYWPGPAGLLACRFDPQAGCMRALPAAILDELCRDAPAGGVAEERLRLRPYLAVAGPIVPASERTLCLELFPDAQRAAYYAGPGRHTAFWMVHDFLPWLHPGWFATGPATVLMPYLRAMRSVPNLSFISAATRREFCERVARGHRAGPVIGLGADGLGLPRQAFHAGRRDFVWLGTIEPRKNAAVVMRAFRQLWADGVEAGLTMIGAVDRDALEEQALLRALLGQPLFRHMANLPDEGVRGALAGARALVFPSQGEGYGLPPSEALHAGIPVIIAADLPAFEGLPGCGQIRLPDVSVESVAGAVRRLVDDRAAAALWAEAGRIDLPTWRGFAAEVAAWVQGGAATASAVGG